MVMGKLIGHCNVPALADPDLQIGGGGRFFRPFGPQFGPKIRGAGPPGPSSGSATDL